MDEFYTDNDVAEACTEVALSLVPEEARQVIIEPSAGGGAFLRHLPDVQVIALDIEPTAPEIMTMDFLQESLDVGVPSSEVLVLGNPPFGWCANLAIKFFNRAAEYADHIAFIVPLTFHKMSTHRKLHKHFHLIYDSDLPVDSFNYQGQPYKVPTTFQVWQRRAEPRFEPEIPENIWLDFVSRDDAEFAIRRVGRRAGEVVEDWQKYSSKGLWFVRSKHPRAKEAIQAIGIEGFHVVSEKAVGSKSIAVPELLIALDEYFKLNP